MIMISWFRLFVKNYLTYYILYYYNMWFFDFNTFRKPNFWTFRIFIVHHNSSECFRTYRFDTILTIQFCGYLKSSFLYLFPPILTFILRANNSVKVIIPIYTILLKNVILLHSPTGISSRKSSSIFTMT